jgi:hypothetical protein
MLDMESTVEPRDTVDPEETEPALDFNPPVINIPSNDILRRVLASTWLIRNEVELRLTVFWC